MRHQYESEYKNVQLRPIEKKDIESLRKWRNNIENTVFLRKLQYITPEMQNKWYVENLENNNEMYFAILENKTLNRLVGSLCLYDFTEDSCFFGKILIGDKEAHGKKIGLNATVAALQIAFNLIKLKKVFLFVYSDNYPALKIYKEAGFVITDTHKDSFGKDEIMMSIERNY